MNDQASYLEKNLPKIYLVSFYKCHLFYVSFFQKINR